ncbi:MAG: endonuclease domain-containing protein [Cyclobacteriaceae bacterium]
MTSELHKGASRNTFEFAKENRKHQTEAEKILWDKVRNRNLDGFKFRRQYPIGSFIVDFYCYEARLVVEVDGGYHKEKDQKDYDAGRTMNWALQS